MALINNSFQFIFVHIPKAAGTSITSVLSRYTNYCDLEIGGTHFGELIQPAYRRRFGIGKHSTAAELRSVVGTVTWSRYLTFAFVRNPFSRCLSTFHFLRMWEGVEPKLAQRMKGFSSFKEYVLSGIWAETDGPDGIIKPQVHWLRRNAKSSEMLVDYVGRTERIDVDFPKILQLIDPKSRGLKEFRLPILNRSDKSFADELKDDAVAEKIFTTYRADFDAFGYPPDPASQFPLETDVAALRSE
jgi:hypothetical protein